MNTGKSDILYIDDDPDDLFIFGETLESDYPEFHITKAHNGQDGLTMLENMRVAPVLVVLDLNMPKMNGIQTLRIIRQNPRWAQIPVVMFTTAASAADTAAAASDGARVILKPMNYQSLRMTVKTIIDYCRAGNGAQE